MNYDFRNQLRAGFIPTDYLVLILGLFLITISLVFYPSLDRPWVFIPVDVIFVIAALMIPYYDGRCRHPLLHRIHILLPIITYSVFYVQATIGDHIIFTETFDPLLRHVELTLFKRAYYLLFAPAVDSVLIDELMHFFYFSYFLIIFLPAILLIYRRKSLVYEMIFSLTLMLYIHYLFFIIFPGDGPVAERAQLFNEGYIFVPLMRFIYTVGGNQGGGAFPSTHAATAVIILLYSFRDFERERWPIRICVAGILIATVYGSYHYLIDTIAGIVTGTGFYVVGCRWYSRLRFTPRLIS